MNKNEEIILIEPQLFGSINYYISLIKNSKLLFEQYEHYYKQTFFNRFYIAGANGPLLLTVPVVHEHQKKTAFKDLRISYTEPWQRLHWRGLISAYSRSPWFEFYYDKIEVIYFNKYKYIIDLWWNSFELVQEILIRKWNAKMTESFRSEYTDTLISDRRHALIQDYNLSYPQVFEDRNGFLPNLSILDLIFCEGKNAGKLLSETAILGGKQE